MADTEDTVNEDFEGLAGGDMEAEALEGMGIGEQMVLGAGDQEAEVGTSEAGPQAREESAPPGGSLSEPNEGLEATHREEEVEVDGPEEEEEEVDEVHGFYCGKNGIKSSVTSRVKRNTPLIWILEKYPPNTDILEQIPP